MIKIRFLLINIVFLLFVGNAVAEDVILVSDHGEWKYLDTDEAPGAGWNGFGFDDSKWPKGKARFGFGEGDEATLIKWGEDKDKKRITTYFRRSFMVKKPLQYNCLVAQVLRDAGAVVYLNGSELLRTNMPEGVIKEDTKAGATVSGPSEDRFYEFYLDKSLLKEGENLLAVEVHIRKPKASDMSFDLRLKGSNKNPKELLKAGPFLVYPGRCDAMTLVWGLNKPCDCALSWGFTRSCSEGQILIEEEAGRLHIAHTIPGLRPATLYYYQLKLLRKVYRGAFKTAPDGNTEDLCFLAMGDTRTNIDTHDKVCQSVCNKFKEDPRYHTFVLHVGDIVSDGNIESHYLEEHFHREMNNALYLQANLPTQACMGNHEGNGVYFKKYFPYPFVNHRYWSFDYGPAHIAVVDQYMDYEEGSAQLAWLKSDLEESKKQWKFLVYHEPGWAAGGHKNHEKTQKLIQPLCKKYGVDIVFAGHNHYYARCLVDNVHHITTGGGGAPLYDPKMDFPNLVSAEKILQFCAIKINGKKLTFVCIDVDGKEADKFTITH